MIVDMLIVEIAAERGENPKELKEKLVRKIEEEKSGRVQLPPNDKPNEHQESDR